MLIPNFVQVTYYSGTRGGTGKTTLAVNTALALPQSLGGRVVLVDLGVDSTDRASRLLGVDSSIPGVTDFLMGDVNDVDQIIARSAYLPNSVFVVPPGRYRSYQVIYTDVSVRRILDRWLYMVGAIAMRTMARVILVDLPAQPPQNLLIPVLVASHIINLVMEYSSDVEDVLREIDDAYVKVLATKVSKVVNVILNKAFPGVDNQETRIRNYAHGGAVITVPMVPEVHFATAVKLKPAILLEPKGQLGAFRKAVDNVVKTITKQVRLILG